MLTSLKIIVLSVNELVELGFKFAHPFHFSLKFLLVGSHIHDVSEAVLYALAHSLQADSLIPHAHLPIRICIFTIAEPGS